MTDEDQVQDAEVVEEPAPRPIAPPPPAVKPKAAGRPKVTEEAQRSVRTAAPVERDPEHEAMVKEYVALLDFNGRGPRDFVYKGLTYRVQKKGSEYNFIQSTTPLGQYGQVSIVGGKHLR